ncbi:pentatricopeptide repeat-containing protein At1g77360, mitochondrial [Magnolia sinica]|uniref:pentatricopeptide repeat-containing protein At1g77360, mitochondrial n=1 Tax=Magnolia sinica TaxID=86752 RepID=UPI0026582AFF|nr:pentatricopeptide repeat-containing protein At1g77360, mitochondrial [Magnolia sinica]XP_058076726.1 pentatricopeptide repeat-containing protein At1g77360, mitochondrial [Magnolia sinica]XP_058076727.1 pentatricopeptide repeat-containing protein At1g77360, mitochondrial [Magnolia sinica]XP_058076728.1 pentatricopeptide repeat-containing protein At1g77360, mitochondrial [Magnolia sinica]XP_058076729.1 pentatricopeptide repeat-containing protein At1g77360, mitochondrial [Magnolia sinica]XP_05
MCVFPLFLSLQKSFPTNPTCRHPNDLASTSISTVAFVSFLKEIQNMIRWRTFSRMYSSNSNLEEIPNSMQRICKIMMSSPKLGLEHSLDESGIRVSPDLAEEILKRFENAGMLAHRFFGWAGKQRSYSHTVRSYHIMIASLAKIRQYKIMWDLINAMRVEGILNVETFCVIMRKYASAQKADEAVYTFNVMDRFGVAPNLAAFNGLLSALCKAKNVRKAQEIFDGLKDRFVPDSKTYSILLEGWGKEPNLPKVREVSQEMVDKGCNPDIVTYGIMVNALCKAGRVEEAVSVVREMDSKGFRPTSFIYSVLIHTYGSEKRISDAVDTFLEMERNGIKADVAVYNALISAFCRVERFKNIYRVLEEMDHKGVQPNSRTCNIILSGLIGTGENVEAFRVFRRMIKCCEPDSDTYTMMIKMFCESDKMEMALKVWKYMGMKQFVPSMHTLSVLINGLCEKGEVSKACVFMEEMIDKGIRPPGTTFGRLRQLLLKEGRKDVLDFLLEKMNLLVKEPLCD